MKTRPAPLWIAVCFVTLVLALTSPARDNTPPFSRKLPSLPLADVSQFAVPATDVPKELADDARIGVTEPLRFATPAAVNLTPATHGTWEAVKGGRLWRLRLRSAGATDLNLGFSRFHLPEGATLHLYSEGQDYVQGPFTARDNKPHGELWTPMLPGDRLVAELFIPTGTVGEPELVLSSVNRGYRDLFHQRKQANVAKAGACNIDVNCPQADPWRNETRSVARYTVGGSGLCTGTLVNDVAGSTNKHFFLTAAHCGVSDANDNTLVIYWNFESPTCGQHGGGSLAQNQNGTIFRAARADVDMTLVELEDMPDTAFRVFYSGWDRSGTVPPGAVGIHHPNGDEKSISFANTALSTVNNCIDTGGGSVNTHWNVVWNSGVTEPGSSGSGLWTPTHHLVGFLSGGGSACATPSESDCYGKFSVAWSGATSSTRLQDWLDPLNTGAATVPGRDPRAGPFLFSAGATLINDTCAPTNGLIDPGESVTVSFSLKNIGGRNTTNAVAALLVTNGVTAPGAPQNYGVISTNGTTVSRSFTFTASGVCGGTITPTLEVLDGTNNLGRFSFSLPLGSPIGILTQRFDTVTAPALPPGWTSSGDPGISAWQTTTLLAHTAPNSVFANEAGFEGESWLVTPAIAISGTNARLTFVHYYDVESGWDGGVLDISLNNGSTYNDILTAGGSFVSGGYNGALNSSGVNPLAGRDAWTGFSGGFVTTVVRLPASTAGQQVRFRWSLGTDDSLAVNGWYVDSVSVSDGAVCCQSLIVPQIVETRRTNNNLVFSFNTTAGQIYITEFKGTLTTNFAWTPLQTNTGDGTKKSVTNVLGTATNRFYRVKVQ